MDSKLSLIAPNLSEFLNLAFKCKHSLPGATPAWGPQTAKASVGFTLSARPWGCRCSAHSSRVPQHTAGRRCRPSCPVNHETEARGVENQLQVELRVPTRLPGLGPARKAAKGRVGEAGFSPSRGDGWKERDGTTGTMGGLLAAQPFWTRTWGPGISALRELRGIPTPADTAVWSQVAAGDIPVQFHCLRWTSFSLLRPHTLPVCLSCCRTTAAGTEPGPLGATGLTDVLAHRPSQHCSAQTPGMPAPETTAGSPHLSVPTSARHRAQQPQAGHLEAAGSEL